MIILLFVNKPITFFFYLLGLGLMIILSFQGEGNPWFKSFLSIWSIAAFSFIYCTSIPYYYLLKGNEKFEVQKME